MPPVMLLETGSMLSLLLGGGWHKDGIGYWFFLKRLADHSLVKFAVPDVDVMEFLGVCAPVYAADFRGDDPLVTARLVPNNFSLIQERIELMRGMTAGADPQLTIVKTHAGEQYLERLRTKLLPYNPDLPTKRESSAWPPETNEALRRRLLQGYSRLSKAVIQDNLQDKRGHTRSSGLQDRGEIGIADAIVSLQQQPNGKNRPYFVLYEGSDVRARIFMAAG